jgi:hypothetical protein
MYLKVTGIRIDLDFKWNILASLVSPLPVIMEGFLMVHQQLLQ